MYKRLKYFILSLFCLKIYSNNFNGYVVNMVNFFIMSTKIRFKE